MLQPFPPPGEPERNSSLVLMDTSGCQPDTDTHTSANHTQSHGDEDDPVVSTRSTDQLSDASSGYETGVTALRGTHSSLPALLESVLSALDEPKGGWGQT